jgi:hypothetical protein
MIRPGGLAAVVLAALAAPAAAEPSLPPPTALGGECRLLISCPWSGPLAAHFRLSGLVWLPQAGDPRPVSVVPAAALSTSLWGWAEMGVHFQARAGAATDGSPALLQYPITLWARVSPRLGDEEGIGVAGEVRYAIGRGPFDAAGTVYADSQSYAVLVGYRKPRFALHLSGAYQEAAARSYRGIEVGGGLWVMAWRALGLEVGGEALARVGDFGQTGGIFAAALRFTDEHGIAGAMGYAGGSGPGLPRHGPLFVFQMSFGPAYRPHPPAPGYEPLLPLFEGWMGRALRQLGARSSTGTSIPRTLPGQPAFCAVPAALTVRQLRACVVAADRFELSPPTGDVLADVTTVVPPPRLNAACDMCQPDPMPDYSPGGAGYFGACALLRWIRCDEAPWDPPKAGVAAVAGPRPPGVVGVRRAAQVAGAGPRVEAPPAPRGSARAAAIDAALAAPVDVGTDFPRGVRRTTTSLAERGGKVYCEECGVPTPAPQVDHIKPKSKGGKGTQTNAEVLCPDCNNAKSNKLTVPWTKNPVDRRMPLAPQRK